MGRRTVVGHLSGSGTCCLSKYISGVILFMWEVLINVKAHLNLVDLLHLYREL